MDGFLPVLAADAQGFRAWAAWVVLFAPLLAAGLVACWPALRRNGGAAAALAIASVGAGLGLTLAVWFLPALGAGGSFAVAEAIVPWISVGGETIVSFGTRVDELALTMTLVVTGVGFAIFVYAVGYMRGDPSIGRFFGKFALFVFSMLGIVLSPNFFQTFVFWELVGLSSYLLIGYYWTKDSAGEAAKKAFMTNRVGDFGFLLGILMVWTAVGAKVGVYDPAGFGAFDFEVIRRTLDAESHTLLFGGAFAAALAAALVFCGAMGKSAQFPLHVWLPDAMEGPTPVSALMHAATMVAAGIYMVTRCFFVFEDTTWAPTLMAWLGGVTAFLAASMAITQRDIKKVLAYSTLSQLGYMTMALGAGAYATAMFHLTTHAFFKALLFLCAGSVIHGCHHEQDMFEMGGLKKKMPVTHATWAVGTLALCGIPPLAGFWSKDEIIGALFHPGDDRLWGAPLLGLLALLVAGMTAFYMGRAWMLTFAGSYRGHAHPHESPKVMTLPLVALAVFSVGVGWLGIPGHANHFGDFLSKWNVFGAHGALHVDLAVVSVLVAATGLLLARRIYGRRPGEDPLPGRLGRVWTLWNELYYVDRFYLWLVRTVQQGFARLCWVFERQVVIQGLVNGVPQGVRLGGDRLRRVQGGRLGSYVTSFLLGAVVVAVLVLVQMRFL
jgi:NADH-quinone oxidoreductase subunit L